MPNENSNNWVTSEFEKLVELVKPHPFLYNVKDPSRKNILARESTWELIARDVGKPVEECKTRWRALRDGYMKTARLGSWNMKPKVGLFKSLEFLNESDIKESDQEQGQETEVEPILKEDSDQQVITDNQEYYEIMLVDNPQETNKVTYISKHVQPLVKTNQPPIKIGKKNCGRRKKLPIPVNLQPIKILPKPVNVLNGANLVQLVEDTPKMAPQPQATQPQVTLTQHQRSEVLDSLIERVLSEHTNSIDVFFRSMAASVKKLPPTLIPKVKMEVCNVIAKYEIQSFDKTFQNYVDNCNDD